MHLVKQGVLASIDVARAVLVTAGRPALSRGLAVGAAIGVVGTIVFAGNGMKASDLVHLFHVSWGVRASLWAAWTLLATPAIASAFDAPGTRILRSLGIAPVPLFAALLALLALLESPWALLFWRGGGAAQAAEMTALAVAVHGALATARARPRAAWPGAVAFALAAWDLPPALVVLPALGLAVASMRTAWRWGLDRPRVALRLSRPMPTILSLALVHLLRLARVERTRLALAAMGAASGCGFLSFSLRNDPTSRPIHRAVLVMTLPMVQAAGVLAAPLLEVERSVRPWLHSLKVRAWTAALAFAIALTTPSSALAACAGALAGAAGKASPWQLSAGLAVASVGSTVAVAGWARAHESTRKRDPVVFVIGVFAIALGALGGAAAW